MDPHGLRPAVVDGSRHTGPAVAVYVAQAEQEPLGGMIQAVHGRLDGGQLVGVYASLQGGFPLEGEVSFEVGFGHGAPFCVMEPLWNVMERAGRFHNAFFLCRSNVF